MQQCECVLDGADYLCLCPCGVRIRSPRRHVFHVCEPPAEVLAMASPALDPGVGLTLFQKAANFAASAAKHVAAGMPQASEAEVARRFAICEGCEHYDGKACRQCGCPVVREKKFLSKLSWANESCPVGKWGPMNSHTT